MTEPKTYVTCHGVVRRRWSPEQKEKLIERYLEGRETLEGFCQEHDLVQFRRWLTQNLSCNQKLQKRLLVEVSPKQRRPRGPALDPGGVYRIYFDECRHVCVDAQFDESSLRGLLKILKELF